MANRITTLVLINSPPCRSPAPLFKQSSHPRRPGLIVEPSYKRALPSAPGSNAASLNIRRELHSDMPSSFKRWSWHRGARSHLSRLGAQGAPRRVQGKGLPAEPALQDAQCHPTCDDGQACRRRHAPTHACCQRGLERPPCETNPGKELGVDSGSQPNIADCENELPGPAFTQSDVQSRGDKYNVAGGTLIPNLADRIETKVRYG